VSRTTRTITIIPTHAWRDPISNRHFHVNEQICNTPGFHTIHRRTYDGQVPGTTGGIDTARDRELLELLVDIGGVIDITMHTGMIGIGKFETVLWDEIEPEVVVEMAYHLGWKPGSYQVVRLWE
jgi:hypothetical protein